MTDTVVAIDPPVSSPPPGVWRTDALFAANNQPTSLEVSLDGKPISPDGNDGLRAQLLADAATQSRETGKPVKVS